MKHFFSLSIVCTLLFLLTACSSQPDTAKDGSAADTEHENMSAANEEPGTAVPTGEKPLIVYFTADENAGVDAVSSASIVTVDGEEKGLVRAVADMIAQETGGDLFPLVSETPYPTDRDGVIEAAAEEQDADARPVMMEHIENLEDYDTVFIGYPTWWYDMPMILYSFFDEYDLSGKAIIPFNVHNGSRFSGTIDTIQQLEPDAKVVTDGFTVSEQDVPDADNDVSDWLRRVGY